MEGFLGPAQQYLMFPELGSYFMSAESHTCSGVRGFKDLGPQATALEAPDL